jgi:hypothetical protein
MLLNLLGHQKLMENFVASVRLLLQVKFVLEIMCHAACTLDRVGLALICSKPGG